MLYMIFQYGREPVLIQRILIGFEAILERIKSFLPKAIFMIWYYPFCPHRKAYIKQQILTK